MREQNIHYEDIGTVVYLKSKRAKSLRISVNRQKGVKVTVPSHVPMSYAFKFVESKKDWIQKSIERFRQYSTQQTLFKPGIEFGTRFHVLQFVLAPEQPLKIKVAKGFITINYPSEKFVLEEKSQDLIRKAIAFALRKEAKHYFPLRVEILAKKFGFNYNDLRVKDLKSRWGSCSAQNNINLNIHLMRLPEYLSDYVILHELAHTVHKNHGKLFWKTLDQLTGDAKKWAKEMKQYQTQIY